MSDHARTTLVDPGAWAKVTGSPERRKQRDRFPHTRKSLLQMARDDDPRVRREAHGQWHATYAPILVEYLRSERRLQASDAEEVVAEFVTVKILQGQLLLRFDPTRARLRAFLRVALDNHLRDWARRRRRRLAHESPEVDGVEPSITQPCSFDRVWARSLLSLAIAATKAHCEVTDQDLAWSVLEARVIDPALHGTEPTPYAELVARLGIPGPVEAGNLLVSGKRILRRCVEAQVRRYALDPADVRTEMQELSRALGGESR